MSSEPRNAYVVTQGDYSDYQVMAVFSTEDAANAYVKAAAASCFYDVPRVEAFPIDVPPEHWHCVTVWMRKDGVVLNEPSVSFGATCEDSARVTHDGTTLTCWVRGSDVQRAIKVANEKRVQLIASGAWRPDWRSSE